jgi:DNA-binding sugar fermentation-stimulating protein
VASLIIPNGTAITRDKLLSQSDAELLRKYKQFMVKYKLREALYCVHCEDAERMPGLRASVTDSKIDMECRCTVRRYRGQTY